MCNLTKDNIIQKIENIKMEVESLQGMYSRIVESGALEFFGIEDDFEIGDGAKAEINQLIVDLIDEIRELDSISNQAIVIREEKRNALIEDLENCIEVSELNDIEELLNKWIKILSDVYIPKKKREYLERLKKLDKYLNKKSWSIKKKYKFKQIEEETGVTEAKVVKALEYAEEELKREEI